MKNLIAELRWRGLIQDIVPGTEERLCSESIAGYIGFDPTSDSLHVGSLLPIMLLVQMQKAGHVPIALVGGATGMVGDPSGKIAERKLLTEELLQHNLKSIQKQLEQFLDFSADIPNPAQVVNNYDWFKGYNFLNFIRDIGKHISVNYMMAKESVKKRLESEQGISFTEFSYQLLQAYDFLWLFQNHNCILQMGGSDQWGNITTGVELIRRKTSKECFAFTCPLIIKSDGNKFGKSANGNVWLDPNKTSPYHFYQFWINTDDTDAKEWIKKFTLLSKNEVENLIVRFEQAPHERLLQKKLAEILTTFVHGYPAYKNAIQTSKALFGNEGMDFFKRLSLEAFEDIFKGVPIHQYDQKKIDHGARIVAVLADSRISSSKGEARKLIHGGAILINKEKITQEDYKLTKEHTLFDKYILVNKGRKKFFLIKIT